MEQSQGFWENLSPFWLALAVGAIMAVPFIGLFLYNEYLGKFFSEVRDESTGGVAGFGTVFVRRLGAMNRRFMWPGYEAKMRRNLIKGGEPQGYKPEDIMALQEIGLFGGLVAGLI